jgi:glycosyltransferase involved in cell wall biosynthesis
MRQKKSLAVTMYIPLLYPWVVDLQKALGKRVGKINSFTIGIFGNYPAWKSLEKDIKVLPNRIILGDCIPSIKSYFEIFQNPSDLIILDGTETTGSLIISLMARLKRVPFLLIIEENLNVRKFYSLPLRILGALKTPIIKLIYQNADILLPESDASKRYLKELGINSDGAKVAPHGIDVKAFEPRSPDRKFAKELGLIDDVVQSKFKILYAGGFLKHKGIGTIIRLMQKNLLNKNMVLIIPVFGENIKEYKKKLSKFKQVRLIPQLDTEGMKKILSIVDVVLVPSMFVQSTERSPNVVSEAMASGKAVIASDMGGIPTMVGNAGILVPEDNEDAIAHELEILYSDRKKIRKLGIKAREHAQRFLSVEAYSETILNEYFKIMNTRKTSGKENGK